MIQLNGAGQRRVVGVGGSEEPLVGGIGCHSGGIGQDSTCVIHPHQRTGVGVQRAAGSGQASICQRLAAGGDSSVLGCASGGRSGDGDLHLRAGDGIVVRILCFGRLYLYCTDLDGSQLAGGGVNGRLAGAIGHSVGHSPGAGAAAGTQLQSLTIDHGGTAGESQSRLVILCCEGNDHIDSGARIVVGVDGHGQIDDRAVSAAGDGVFYHTGAIYGKAAHSSSTGSNGRTAGRVGQRACVSGHTGGADILALLGIHGVLLADGDVCQRGGVCLTHSHRNIDVLNRLIVDGVGGSELRREVLGSGGTNSRAGVHPTPASGSSNVYIRQSLAVLGSQTGGNGVGRCGLRDLRTGDGQHLGGCQRIVAGSDGIRGKGDLICLVDIGTVVFQRTGDSEGVGTNQRPGLYRNGKASGRIGIGVVDLGDRAGVGQVILGQRFRFHRQGVGDLLLLKVRRFGRLGLDGRDARTDDGDLTILVDLGNSLVTAGVGHATARGSAGGGDGEVLVAVGLGHGGGVVLELEARLLIAGDERQRDGQRERLIVRAGSGDRPRGGVAHVACGELIAQHAGIRANRIRGQRRTAGSCRARTVRPCLSRGQQR